MAGKSWWKGPALYSSYLALLAMIWYTVESALLPAAMGLGLGVLLGAAMAIFWPRW